MWYNLSPAAYARALRFYAQRNYEAAAHKDKEGKSWSAGEADRSRQQANRLRAMAILAERATAERAGDVDFLGMNRPGQTLEEEQAAIAKATAVAI